MGVDRRGPLRDYAINERAEKPSRHPDTNCDFAALENVPSFTDAVQLCVAEHRNVLHHDLVSWDIAVDEQGEPVFLEYNFRGALWLYQMAAASPLLGEYT